MEKSNHPNVFWLRCLQDVKYQTEEKGKYNEAETARKLGVNRSTISRWMKKSQEQGFVSGSEKKLTKKGEEYLRFYDEIEKDLMEYFENLGVEEGNRSQAAAGMIDSVDSAVIRKMCQKEKKHLRYDKIGENEGKEIRQVPYEQLKDFLKAGTYPVDFALYRQGKDRQTLSMADMGFQKPGYLVYEEDRQYLELAIQEIRAYTKGGVLLSGHVQSIKYRNRQDVIEELPFMESKVRIPLQAFWFETLSEWEMSGQVQLFMTSSVGERRMPESSAVLILRF